ncbi:MAG: hypothetical protein HY674_01760 [Chloroflexi bacterium]|nr:hypothetical protein [Chloroflexota bacterium]
MSAAESRMTFFRQSGWMVVANTLCGFFMAAVHPFASLMPPDEWSVFFTLLRVFAVLSIAAAGLQTIFAQQTAAAVTDSQHRELAGTVRAILGVTFVIWLIMAGVVASLQNFLVAALKITNPLALWITIFIVLAGLWLPIMQGLLQGAQKFLWFGWTMIFTGFGRFAAVALIVWVLHGFAAGAMAGALFGVLGALLVGGWHCRRILWAPGAPFVWQKWLSRALPLTLGVGASLFIINADMLVVQSHFPSSITPYYGAGSMIGVALVTLTTPLAAVMFPKIVRSLARSEKTDALVLAMGATVLLGGLAAVGCTVFPELPLRIMFFTKPEYLKAAPLVPWFMWCMVPLTVANVLVGNLLARAQFAAVPWLVAVAAGYGITLTIFVHSAQAMEPFRAFRAVVQILGLFGLLLLAVAAWFTWREKERGQGQVEERI